MLKWIKEQRDVDYVIVWKVDRFGRNRRDDANMLFEIELAGARLISVTENIDQTPAGRLMHGMLASFAECYNRNPANEVLKGATEKAKRGGTPGRARVGYLNVREQLPQGGEVRTIALDPERAPLIRWAFETYATGLYSTADIMLLLEAGGLRTRGDRRHGPQPLGLSTVQNMLFCPYYAGIVTYRGNTIPAGTSRSSARNFSIEYRPSLSRTTTQASATAGTWRYIQRHVEMSGRQDELLEAIRQPDLQEPDPHPGRERYWLCCRAPFTFRWMRVVVEFAGDADRFVTAFGRDNDPDGLPR